MRSPVLFRSALVTAAALAVAACVPTPAPPPRPAPPPFSVRPAPPPTPARPVRHDLPTSLLNAVQALGGGFDGQVAISVRDVEHGWTIAWNGDRPQPQQSVSKLWVAIAVLDAVDRGQMSLGDPVTVRKSDLTVFHQPIRAEIGPDGFRTTVRELLQRAMTQSDNTCNDVLLWKVGGPDAVRRMLASKGVTGVSFGPGERELQARTAGLSWQPDWAGGWGFLQARAAMSYEARSRALTRYLADPYDGASANGITLGLSLLARGQLLSPASTQTLLSIMRQSRTGPLRLKSGLQPGWSMAHKTGTGQELGALATGYNDVGLLTAPDGHRYAVSVMIASTRQPIPARMRLMGDVTRAVIRAAH